MAAYVITNTFVLLGAVDLNDHIDSATLELDSVAVPRTNMGSAGWDEIIGGLKSAKLTIDFQQDFAAAKVDATIFPLLGTLVTFEIRPTAGARSATNPAYTGSVLVSQYKPLDGKVGVLAVTSATWTCSGAVSRLTA